MKVIIMCGGKGTRLREETVIKPKPMVEIGGRPVLWHIMNIYARFGFKDFILPRATRANTSSSISTTTTSATRISPWTCAAAPSPPIPARSRTGA